MGAHAPEFSFEHELDNVRRAIGELDVAYPVVIDNEFAIWRAFGNHYWPAAYLVDGDGQVRFHHFGEGAYAEIERAIQALLEVDEDLAEWSPTASPRPPTGTPCSRPRPTSARGGAAPPRAPGALALNEWRVAGSWTLGEESALLEAGPGTLSYRFHARDLNLVLGGGPARFSVRLDGEPPGDAHGVDIAASGEGTLDEPRMYQLIRQPDAVAERLFEITFEAAGARAYVFTFG